MYFDNMLKLQDVDICKVRLCVCRICSTVLCCRDCCSTASALTLTAEGKGISDMGKTRQLDAPQDKDLRAIAEARSQRAGDAD